MRKWVWAMVLMAAVMCAGAAASADVAIDETNFPDDNFRSYVTQFDTDGDGAFSDEELGKVTYISCENMNIADLTGIEHFTALETLSCVENKLMELDISHNTSLTVLGCNSNKLTKLDVSHNTALTDLYCFHNHLSGLDISSNTALYVSNWVLFDDPT